MVESEKISTKTAVYVHTYSEGLKADMKLKLDWWDLKNSQLCVWMFESCRRRTLTEKELPDDEVLQWVQILIVFFVVAVYKK